MYATVEDFQNGNPLEQSSLALTIVLQTGLHPLHETENMSIKVDISRKEMSSVNPTQAVYQRVQAQGCSRL